MEPYASQASPRRRADRTELCESSSSEHGEILRMHTGAAREPGVSDGIYSDAAITWPLESGPKLSTIIGELQRLNPTLGLRCARRLDGEREFLLHNGTERDVLMVVMPAPPSDDLMGGFTNCNYEWLRAHETSFGSFRTGKRRFERTADGNLRIRPFTWELEKAGAGRFNWARQRVENARDVIDQIGRIARSWFVFTPPHDEIWEVDFAYMPADYLDSAKVGKQSNIEFWRTKPTGTISYVDQYDLPIDEHYRRAREIVKAGSDFAIVADMQTGELRIFRVGGVESSFEAIQIPEMPWFNIPIPSANGNA